ncbi:zinc finger, CCHC-type containing protein [Tanacetum coccineum]|uniref:Zinc finger, CCHC-type containing protein n=1 Tax=Tanacetum coccineum TaxID=301880 RepID=A0ABQ4Z1Y0_9ASTR
MDAAAMKYVASNFAKLEKFEGVDFRRWQKKMHFLLSSISVVYVLTTPIPDDGDDATDSLEAKYMAEDASSKKFLVSNFTNYKMTDSRPVMEQYNELLGILRRFTQHKMNMDEAIKVFCIIDKLPPSWKDFKHTLKHLKEELTLVELGSHLRIEESLRMQDSNKPKGNNVAGPSVVNMVEHNNSSRYNDNKGKRKHHDNTKADPNKKSKDDDVAWWVDSGATVHVCKDRCWFKTYESLNDGSILHMRNESTALVQGRGFVDLMFSSGKIVSLLNVLHVPNIRKNLVSSSVLNNGSYKQVIESNKFILSKHGVFIGFGYLSNQMFRLNIVNDNIASAFISTSKLNDSIIWHARLGHVHFKRMQDMSKDGLIPTFDMDTKKLKLSYNKGPKSEDLGLIGEVKEALNASLLDMLSIQRLFWFYVIEPNDSVAINLIIESRDAIFDENRFSLVPRPSLSIPKGTEDIGGSVVPEVVTDEVVQQPESDHRKIKMNRTPKDFRPEFQLYLIEGTRDEVSDQHSYLFNVEDDPKTFDEAIKSQDIAFWKEEINDDMNSIMGNNTWVLADLPPGCKPLGYNLIFKRKLKIDVKIAFLNGDLDEEVYMNQPQGFIMSGNENKVCKLIKSLYELKLTPTQRHQKFNEVVLSNGYLLNQADKCVYSKFVESGKGVIICLYVDDMLIFSTDQIQVNLTKEFLSLKFSMKDIGEADVILGIRIIHESNGIASSQSHYIKKVLKKFNYFDCTLVSTPMDTSEKLMPNNGQAVPQIKYSRVIGCLMYAMTCTRPDIAFVVGKLSRLTYVGYPSVLEGYTDASWISNTEDNSSTSGWVFLLGGGAISWASKKQTCITRSIMEFEFVALAAASKEAEWLKNLLFEIPLWVKPIAPISIHCDSATTLAKACS